jgi:hypothetical protein
MVNSVFSNDCPICHSENNQAWIICEDSQRLNRCNDCGLGYLAPYPTPIGDLYKDYGDYITQLPSSYFENRLRVSAKKRAIFTLIKMMLGKDARLLDYGGGAGLFVGVARKLGIKNSYLFEPSENFRRAAIERVGIEASHVVDDISKLQGQFDFVSMLDVIEHLPQEKLHFFLTELTAKMTLGGYLFGETPNRRSWNLMIFGQEDPVIAPPSHLTYFTKRSLHKILSMHGFKRKVLVTWGVSHNSFFRKSKFSPSFVEQPQTKLQGIFALVIRGLFKISGPASFLANAGYQIIFLYKLEQRKPAEPSREH